MDARTTAALAAVLRQANCDAAAENARLRQELRHVRQAVLEGNRDRALRRLSLALNEHPGAPPRTRGPFLCAMCGNRARRIWQMPAVGRWRDLPPDRRELCGACYRMQPSLAQSK